MTKYKLPVVKSLAAKILAAIEAEPTRFDMRTWVGVQRGAAVEDVDTGDVEVWDRCDTALCMAGWAVFLAGPEAREAAADSDVEYIARGLFEAAGETRPDFYEMDHKVALAQLRYLATNPTADLEDVP